mmetsp:Transcript_31547/g.66045  ORF Transcript_31547/g.66045 Transcript_31547/m.66045 type:complete len:282 (-) Transcript_31547:107-952(-)
MRRMLPDINLVESEAKANRVDDTIRAFNIHGVVIVGSEGLLSNNGIIDEMLTDGVTVNQGSGEGLQVGSGNIRRSNLARDDVHLDDVSSDLSPEGFVRLKSRVGGGEDGVGSSSELSGNASGLKRSGELAEVLVSLKVVLLESLSNSKVTPDLSRSLKIFDGTKDVSSSSARSGGGCGGSRSGSGRSSDLSRRGTSITLLQVLLERRGGRDRLTGILVSEGFRITGISHTSRSKLLVKGGGHTDRVGGGEGASTSDKSGGKEKLHDDSYLVGELIVFSEKL